MASHSMQWFKSAAFGILALLVAAAAVALWRTRTTIDAPPLHSEAPVATSAEDLRIDQPRQAVAGIRVERPRHGAWQEYVWRTGRIVLNQDRIAHISPLVEGVVREVHVQLGQNVGAGDVLAVLDSREVGQAKLDLVKARLAVGSATALADWTTTTSTNAEAMLDVLLKEAPLAEIERLFRDRPLGEWRHQLMGAYSRRIQTKAQYDNVKAISGGAVSESSVRKAQADFEAAEATYNALCEELRFQARQQLRAVQQTLREARASEDVVQSRLLMMGFTRDEIASLDPIGEGARVSHYPIRAPFAGAVVSKHAVLSERVGPDHMMFQLADLSHVWIEANLFDTDLPYLQNMDQRSIQFRAPAAAISSRSAEILYKGDLIDPQSRALTLTAVASNKDRQLKPGLFVEVGLPKGSSEPVLQVPSSAIVRDDRETFVFVRVGLERFRKQDVLLGRDNSAMVEIRKGLDSTSDVVVDGTFTLKSELLRDRMAGD